MEIKLINFKQVFFLLAMTIVIAGCSSFSEMNNEDDSSGVNNDGEVSLKGTKWKLAGIVDTRTGDLKVLEPKDCEECYTLMFDTDFTAIILSVNMILKIDLQHLSEHDIPQEFIDKMLFCEKYYEDGEDYCDSYLYRWGIAFASSFTATPLELKLFSTPDSYLLFKPF